MAAVAATAGRLLGAEGRELTCFTAVPRPGFTGLGSKTHFEDEGAAAAEVAALYPNMRHVLVESSATSFLDILDHNNNLYDHPCFGPSNEVWFNAIMARAREDGITLLLNGNCGNSTLSYDGMPALSAWFRSGQWGTLARVAWQLARAGNSSARAIVRHAVWPSLPFWLRSMTDPHLRGFSLDYSVLHPEIAQRLDLERTAFRDLTRSASDGRTMLRTLLEYGDIADTPIAAQGGWQMDFRDPTYDRRVVEFCLTAPLEEFLRGGQQRSLARRAMVGRLPPSTLSRTQRGRQSADWYREHGCSAWPDGGRGRAFAEFASGEPHAGPGPHALPDRELAKQRFRPAGCEPVAPHRAHSWVFRGQISDAIRPRQRLVRVCVRSVEKHLHERFAEPQIPPLCNASVGMTNLFGSGNTDFQTKLSSRPKRTRISCHAALDETAYAPFFKGKAHESRQRHQALQEIRGSVVEGAAVYRVLKCNCNRAISAEDKADGESYRVLPSGGGQQAGPRVAGEDNDIRRVLVGNQQPLIAGIKGEMAGSLASTVHMLHRFESSIAIADGENRHTVIAPVGGIQEPAGGINRNRGRRIHPLKPSGRVEMFCSLVRVPRSPSHARASTVLAISLRE